MNEEDKSELRALVVGFLQQGLKDNPRGYSVQDFERLLPQVCDEPRDWYKRYKKNSTLEAIEVIQDAVSINFDQYDNKRYISLNMKSDKVDNHLIDLITHQRPSGKKKSRSSSRPSSRAAASFSLNRQYANSYNRSRARLNHDQQYRNENLFSSSSHRRSSQQQPTFLSSSYRNAQSITNKASPAIADPRLRNSSMIPPQIKSTGPPSIYSRSSSTAAQSLYKPQSSQAQPVQSKNLSSVTKSVIPPKSSVTAITKEQEKKEQDPALIQKKEHLRQRIVHLLTFARTEIKLLFLGALYKSEFDENLDPQDYKHKSLTDLLQDPIICDHITIKYGSPFVTISARCKSPLVAKENVIAPKVSNSEPPSTRSANDTTERRNCPIQYSNAQCLEIQAQVLSAAKRKVDATEIFNVRTMLQNLEPLGEITEKPSKNMEIDNMVKYKTMRIIYKSPDSTIKIDDWPVKFEQESRLRIRIKDYGFNSLLKFFEQLALELPISLRRNENEEWLASIDIQRLSVWIQDKMDNGQYKAITAIESRYELVAYPFDLYSFTTEKDLAGESNIFHPAFILSVKLNNYMWIQLRTPKRIEAHLCVEASMESYKDYKKNNLLTVPISFVKPGFPCAVFDTVQQRWCRALILKAPEKIDRNYDVKVLLVDYATERVYPISKLSCLMRSHLKLPVQPIYAKLSAVKNESGILTKKILQEYTCPPVTLACKFLRAIPSNEPHFLPESFFEVTLVDTRQDKDCNLADDCNGRLEDDE